MSIFFLITKNFPKVGSEFSTNITQKFSEQDVILWQSPIFFQLRRRQFRIQYFRDRSCWI